MNREICRSLRKWTIAHPYLFTFIGFVFFFIFFTVCKIHAEAPASLGRDALVDALGAFAAGAGAFEAAATGNMSLGIALTALSGLEAEKAWNEARQAWRSNDSPSGGERMGTENDH